MQINDELENTITARNVPDIKETLKNGKVAIAGLGGLGSNIAVMLARIGVGKLLLVDFDVVEPSNLNRQYYDLTHLGMLKTEALKSQIEKINPFVATETCAVKVTAENATEIFKDYTVVCEAFDNPQDKAVLVNTLLENGEKKIVAASGMTGFDSANKIKTKKMFENLYVCGDSEPAKQEGIGFMAPRVTICAGHQANMALRLLLNIRVC
ncbi:MAG: sulfur carrier protein ThiS adenylyltransferase ThiF [Endomicrobia bacterium]|nr:sulfur carrier protein ThiS adenylyltransferase ThiF [Endomicrobiia bacterium]MCL2507198.1 sulfur carrier protein ThiS adenylyltransferase ThiF [Endomicrobiia bacterium]